jgi:hypothetical protein
MLAARTPKPTAYRGRKNHKRRRRLKQYMKLLSLLGLFARLALIGVFCTAASAQVASAKSPILAGRVINRLTGEPIALATVLVAKDGAPPFSAATISDSLGRFQFTDLTPGNYLLSADRSEFIPSQPVPVDVGGNSAGGILRLAPLGVIAGTVFAEDGDPAPGVLIAALRLTTKQGKPLLSQVARTTTDDLGDYRLHGLAPGRYYVKANLRGHSADVIDDGSLEAEHRAIFYPHAADQDGATFLDVVAGGVLTGINLALPVRDPVAVSDAQSLSSSESAIIQGQVLNAATGDPIPNAYVALANGDNSPAGMPSMRSDASGNFSFNRLPPGTYQFAVTRAGFLPRAPGIAAAPGSERSITVTAGQVFRDVSLRLMPQGVIAGRILEGSVPISNAIVMATRSSFLAGQQKLVLVKRTYTNDLGEYRLFGLPPGHYYVSVTYHGGTAPGSPGLASTSTIQGPPPKEDYVNTFYPEALTLADAVPLEVTPGSIQASIDVALFRMRKLAVRGKVLLLPGVHFTSPLTAVLLPRDPAVLVKFNQQTASVDARTGAFEISGVTPGRYTLAIDAQARDDRYAASVQIDVTKSDVAGLVITLTRSFPIMGHVTAEGSDQCDFSGLTVQAQSSGEQGVSRGASASVNDNGSFTLENLRSDRYRLGLAGPTGNCYLKSISLGSGDVTLTDAQLSRGSPPIGFILSAAGGKIDGDVIDDQHHPVKSATVVLIPQPSLRGRRDLYKNTFTDPSGKFTLQGIAPGDYKLFAWDAIEPDSYLDPEALAIFEGLGQSVSIQESGQNKIELTIIPNDGSTTH